MPCVEIVVVVVELVGEGITSYIVYHYRARLYLQFHVHQQ